MKRNKIYKKAIVLLLAAVVLAALFPAGIFAQAEQPVVKPFVTVNWSGDIQGYDYTYAMPWFYTSKSSITEDTTKITVQVGLYGNTTDPKVIAQRMKADFDNRPDGARYINLNSLTDTFKATVEDVVYFDRGVTLVKSWLTDFLQEYYAIGGKLDGIAIDLEYNLAYSFYIEDKQYGDAAADSAHNKQIYNQIVANPHYATRVRPKLVDRGFEFYTNPDPSKYPYRSEIWNMYRYSGDAYAKDRSIWDDMIEEVLAEYINEAVLDPLLQYYPDAIVSDYHESDQYSWLKGVDDNGDVAGNNAIKVGNASNYNVYACRPGSNFFKYITDSTTGLKKRTQYITPPSFNDAVYEDSPFGATMWDVNLHKRMLASTDTGNLTSWLAPYNYGEPLNNYKNTPYYSETVFHVGLANPQPFLGFIIQNSMSNETDNKLLTVVDELMAELTRVAGASDRRPIRTPISWNGSYVLSGMYAGGRNIWRITPDTTVVSLEDFKVEGQVPTFSVDGQTITFPRGRIIEDGEISQVGTCGYWVETPADVQPVITSTADRYQNNPSFQETFENYNAGAFTSTTAFPHTYWTVSGNAVVETVNGNNALALSGSTTLTNAVVPKNITAGDEYAKQQAWEVTFTLPDSGSYGTVNLFGITDSDGLRINNNKVYYYSNYGIYYGNTIANLEKGGTYTAKRVLDFTGSTYYNSFYIYDATGKLIGSAENKKMKSVTLPVSQISFATSSAIDPVRVDDYKLYPLGVNTVFELFEAKYGRELKNISAAQTANTAYRLSWMNASDKAQTVCVLKNGAVIDTVVMAPGMDGVVTGVVEASEDAPVTLTLSTVAETTVQTPTIDTDTNWGTYGQALGVACLVGSTGYAKLEDAIAAAKPGQTVVMLDDGVMDAPAVVNKAVTIQGNGKTVTISDSFKGDHAIGVVAGGDLSITKGLILNTGDKTGVYVTGGTVDGIDTNIATIGTALLIEQDPEKTPVYITLTDSTLSGSKAFVQRNAGENVFAVITDTTVTGTVETETAFPVKWDAADSFHLHWNTEIDPAVRQTCTDTGLTEGSHYLCCDEIKVAQNVIPADKPDRGHIWLDATCIAPMTCYDCGATNGEAIGHNWQVATCNAPATCAVCGETEGAALQHNYVLTITPPTASNSGVKTYICSLCGHSYTETMSQEAAKFVLNFGRTNAACSTTTPAVNSWKKDANTITMGGAPKCFVNTSDTSTGESWLTETGADANNWNVKFEYPADGTPVLTLNNVNINAACGIIFGENRKTQASTVTCSVPLKIVLIGNNTITTTNNNFGGLDLYTTGDVTVEGDGTLQITTNKSSSNGGAISVLGDITFRNTNVELNLNPYYGKSHAIAALGGDIIIDGGNMTVNGIDVTSDDSNTQYQGETIYSVFYTTQRSNGTGGSVILRSGANVTAKVSPIKTYVVNAADAIIIDNSTVELGITGHYWAGSAVFNKAPQITGYTHYVALAATNKSSNAAIPPANTAEYNAVNATTYTYFKVWNHTHTADPATAVVTAPKCTVAGYTTYTCADCGITYKANETAALEHNGTVKQTVQVTCTEDGYTLCNCTVCGEDYRTNVVNATGHKYTTQTIAPTCTNVGYTAQTCSVCGDKYNHSVAAVTGHSWTAATCTAPKTCSSCSATEGEALGHKYGSVVTNPTCTAGGYTTHICSVCSDTYTDAETPANGHTDGEVVVENEVKVSCTTDGSYDNVTYCTVCGAETSRKTVTVKTEGHKYGSVVTKPTCTAGGYTTHICSVCSDTYTDAETPANGHTDGEVVVENEVKVSCTTDGSYDDVTYCTVCGAETSRKTVTVKTEGHKYASVVTKPTCTAGGYTTHTCSVCGNTYTDANTPVTGHTYSFAVTAPTCTTEGYTTYTCDGCGNRYVTDRVSASHLPGEYIEERVPATTAAAGYVRTGVKCAECEMVYNENTVTLPKFTTPKIYYISGSKNGSDNSAVATSKTLDKSSRVYYFTIEQVYANVAQSDVNYKNRNNTYTVLVSNSSTFDEENTNSWVKFAYGEDGIPTLTLKNVHLVNDFGITVGGTYTSKNYTGSHNTPYNVVLLGENTITVVGRSATCYGALDFTTTGDVTITGPGSLEVISHRGDTYGSIAHLGGNLTFNHANITITHSETYRKSHAVSAYGGNVFIDGGKFTVIGIDDPNTVGSAANQTDLQGEAIRDTFFVAKNTAEKGGDLTICNGAEVTVHASPYTGYSIVNVDGVFNISNSTVELAITGKYFSGVRIFADGVVPTLEAVNGYTAIAGKRYEDATSMVPGRTETYTEENVGNYTYFKVTPNPLDKFLGASIVLGNDLDIRFGISKQVTGNNGYVEFNRTFADGTNQITRQRLSDFASENANNYFIIYPGMAAKEMRDRVAVTVFDSQGNVVSQTWVDSIYEYCLRMLKNAKYADDSNPRNVATKRLMVDMLNYGAMAQQMFTYDTAHPANEGLEAYQKYATAEMTPCENVAATVTGGSGYLGTRFVLESNISMELGIQKSVVGEGGYAMVSFTDYTGEKQPERRFDYVDTNGAAGFNFNGLVAADGRCDTTWQFYNANGELVLTVVDSMQNYVGRMIGKQPHLKYLMIYSDSAKAYFTTP